MLHSQEKEKQEREQNNLHQTGHFCAYINHGQTSENIFHHDLVIVPNKLIVKEDPPLSKLGIARSIYTGRYLKAYFEERNMHFDEIIIRTSPFVKNLTTAGLIAKELGVSKIEVDSVLVETQFNFLFSQNPFKKLELFNCQTDEDILRMKRKYFIPECVKIDTYNDIYKSLTEHVYPEASCVEGIIRSFISYKRSQDDQKRN